MKIKITFFLAMVMFWGMNLYAQTTVTIPSPAYLNTAILGDTADDGTHAETTYILERGGTYYVRGSFENLNFKLHLVAADGDGAMPIVRADLSETGTQNWCMFGGVKDVEFDGIFFDAQSEHDGYGPANWVVAYYGKNANLTFNNCIFANSGQGGVGAWDAADVFSVTNCKFYNMGNIEFSDQGAGRMIETRDSEVGKLIVKHNTLVNCYDRIVRHRNGSGVIKEMEFSHNTIINHGGYFGFMELGNVGDAITIQDNLIIDAMSFAADTSDAQRLDEFNMHGETWPDGKNKIVWVGAIPNDSTVFTIKNNVYSISADLAGFYSTYNVNEGPKLTDTIASRLNNADSAFILKSVSLIEAPAPMIDLVTWYYDNGKSKGVTTEADYNRMSYDYMINTIDCGFTVTDDLMGTDGLQVGDSCWVIELTGIKNNMANSINFNIYPNPMTSLATLQINLDESADVTINVVDITGKTVQKIAAGNLAAGTNQVTINRGDLTSGLYFLSVKAGNQIGSQKLLIK